ncbi:MAG: DUF4102 domain-containing protein [Mesorhizobium sp.]|uniref:tyrosine-type recombinase/integrase n=1 Tax=Mesorhizobium sp. TaxID=1871066 RepID=UPI001217571E|nr:integrase arm-type DNA-binding domain-containing protein [Mesorhizobium sp.]TIR15969.1 MAG: DUF4102 domain-containing protein [Mesorhizobium sp.]
MALSDTAIRALKGQGTAKKYSDGGGLFLFVPPNGSRLWRMAYSFGGKQKTLAIGAYPAVGLAVARKARDAAKELLAQGVDPARQKKLEKIRSAEASENTFEAVAADLRKKLKAENKSPRTIERFDYLIGLANADIGKLPIASISAAEILAVIRKQERRGKLASAAKQRQEIGSVIRYAIATGRAENDPTIALKGAIATRKIVHRPAIRDRKAFGGLLRAIWGHDAMPEVVNGLKLLAYAFPRPGELRQAEWREFDLDAGIWTIPADRMKARKAHRKPLSKQAIEVLREQFELTGDGKLVFPSIRSWGRPISDATWSAALRAMGIAQDAHCPHGFRASASTIMNEGGQWASDAIERELAHVDANEIRRAYARSEFWDERVKMQQWWADLCDSLRQGAKVISMAEAVA